MKLVQCIECVFCGKMTDVSSGYERGEDVKYTGAYYCNYNPESIRVSPVKWCSKGMSRGGRKNIDILIGAQQETEE